MKDTPKQVIPRTGTPKRGHIGLSDRISRFLYQRVWGGNPSGASRTQIFGNSCLRIISIVFLKVLKDAITFRARGLALTAVLAVAPMLALGTAILKDVGIGKETQLLVHGFLDQIVVSDDSPVDQNVDPKKGAQPEKKPAMDSPTAQKGSKGNLVIHLKQIVDKIFDYINRTDFATLGFAGTVAILILVASFFAHLEACMNTIWEVKKGRSLWKRGINYLAVLILLPIAMNLGFAAMAVLQSSTLMERLEVLLPRPWMVSFLLKMFPAMVVAGTFAALYKFLPNTEVSTLYALSGGLFAGISWLLVLLLYMNLQLGVARYNAIYGSFATVPLILLWIYIGWVIFLMGAELVFAFQFRREYDPGTRLLSQDNRLALAINVFRFLKKRPPSHGAIEAEEIAMALNAQKEPVMAVLADLERIGFVEKKAGANFSIVGERQVQGMEFR